MPNQPPSCRRLQLDANRSVPASCPFCALRSDQIVAECEHAVAFRDGFPISAGHTLVIPRLHKGRLYELPTDVQHAVWSLVAIVQSRLVEKLHPDGFNVGLNEGPAAGQTVPHAHVHVIPRFIGDVPDPRGGVRWVLPAKARYWS